MRGLFIPQAAAALVNLQPMYIGNGGMAGNGAAGSTALNVAYPSLIAANDIAFLVVHGDNTSTVTVPGGWTACGAAVTIDDITAGVWWQRLAGTESGNVALTRGSGATGEFFGATIHAFRNCTVTGTPFEGYATPATGTTTTMNGPAVVTSGTKRTAVLFWCIGDRLMTSAPSGSYLEQQDASVNSGNSGGHACDTQFVPAATTIAAVTRTIGTANPSICFGLALVPALGTLPALPLTRNHLGAIAGTTPQGVSITPTPGALLVISVGCRRDTALPAVITCSGGTGLTYNEPAAQASGLSTNGSRSAIFTCRLGGSPGTFTVTAASAASSTGIAINIEEFINADDDVSNAVLAYNASGDVSATLPSNPLLDSIVIAHQICNGSGAYDDPLGFANLGLLSPAGCRMRPSYNQMVRTSLVYSSSNAEATGGGIEIKQA